MFRRKTYKIETPHITVRLSSKYKFKCQRCGECCTNPGYFTPEGLRDAATHLGTSPTELFDLYCHLPDGATIIRPRTIDGYCSLLERDEDLATCRIHSVKPANCQYTPLIPKSFLFDDETMEVKIDERAQLAFVMNCSGFGKGSVSSVRELARRTGFEDDLKFQQQSLLATVRYLGVPKFMQILDLRKTGELSPDLAEELRSAVKASYRLL
ncbi:YkgJ family cysteine cluster protein [Candidatus Aenigmatarchaeota archaeon]